MAGLAGKFIEPINRFVRAFVDTARIRIVNKTLVENWIQNAVNGVVQNSIAHPGFVNQTSFGIADIKRVIRTVAIGFIFQLQIQLI